MNNHEIFEKSETKWGSTLDGILNRDEEYMIGKNIKKGGTILEAGCGGGRISFCMESKELGPISAFDFVESFIDEAKKNTTSKVNFFVADASDLNNIKDNSFEYEVYLQKIFSLIPKDRFRDALRESNRTIKNGGTMICSFLNYGGRKYNGILSAVLLFLRKLRKENKTKQELPWLKLKGKPNLKLLKKDQATVYWFNKDEIVSELKNAGYEILEVYAPNDRPSILYVACKKAS